MRIIIESTSPLSRFYVMRGVPFLKNMATSVEAMHWAIQLQQHECYDKAVECLTSRTRDPSAVAGWAKSFISPRDCDLIFMEPRILKAIMIYLLQHRDNEFAKEMIAIARDRDAHHPGEDVEFLVASRPSGDALVWSCGLRKTLLSEVVDSARVPGFNLYGGLLRDVFNEYTSGSYDDHVSPSSVADWCISVQKGYSRTVLLVSDSQSRYLRSIDGGRIVCKGGATYGRLADEMRERRVRASDYKFVIVVCGVNEARRPQHQWRHSWEDLLHEFQGLHGASETTLIINTPLATPGSTNVLSHSAWIKRRFRADFGGSRRFQLVDWSSNKSGDNSFYADDGALNANLFDRRFFHVNHSGFRRYWKRWCEQNEELKTVAYHMKKDIYPRKIDWVGPAAKKARVD